MKNCPLLHTLYGESITKAELSSRQESAAEQRTADRRTLGTAAWRPVEGDVLVLVELSSLPAQGHGALPPHSSKLFRESVVTGEDRAVHLVGSFHG